MKTYYLHIYGNLSIGTYSTHYSSVYDQFQGITYFIDTHWLGVF